ncbi:MAG: aminotransferase class I/II-fold pyridoxal phosphate-dependent enzyme, partial [Phycisphaerales bacterium]
GWRLGTFLFPPDLVWLLDVMAVVASETYTSVSAPIQYAAVRAFRGGVRIERYLWHARRILAALARRCVQMLSEAGIEVCAPAGAFYLYLDFSSLREVLVQRGIHNGAALCDRLLQDSGVAMLPGSAFARPGEELTARLSYVDFDGSRALAASENIPLDEELPEDFLELWCGHVLAGVRKIAVWVRGEVER